MSIIATNQIANGSTVSQSSYTTVSVTLVANTFYLLTVVNNSVSGAANIPTVTGASATWTQVIAEVDDTGTRRATLFKTSGVSSVGALTIDLAGQAQNNCSWSLDSFTGVKLTGTGPIGGTGIGTQDSAGNTLSITLSPFSSPANYGFGGLRINTFANELNPGAGFTTLGHVQPAAGNSDFLTETELNQNVISWSWSDGTRIAVAVAAEVVAQLTQTPSGYADLSAQDDRPPPRPDYSRALISTTSPVMGMIAGIVVPPAQTTDYMANWIPPDTPGIPDYRRALFAVTPPVLGYPFPTAGTVTPSRFFYVGQEELPRRRDYSRALADSTQPVVPHALFMAVTPSVLTFDASIEDGVPRRPDYSRALESTTHSVVPLQPGMQGSLTIGGRAQPRYFSYKTAVFSSGVIWAPQPPAAATIAPFIGWDTPIDDPTPLRRNYRTVLADTSQPIVPYAFRTAVTPSTHANLIVGQELPGRSDYRTALSPQPSIVLNYQMAAVATQGFDQSPEDDRAIARDYRVALASTTQPILPVFIPPINVGCFLGVRNTDNALGLHNNVDVLGIPCLPLAAVPSRMPDMVRGEDLPRRRDYSRALAPSPALPLRPTPPAQTPTFLFGGAIQESDPPLRRDYRASLAATSPVTATGIWIYPTRCELGLHNGTDTLGLSTRNPTDTLAANCPTLTPSSSYVWAGTEDLPRRRDYSRALIASGPIWSPHPAFAFFGTPSIMANLVLGEDLPRRKDYRIALMVSGPIFQGTPPITVATTPTRWFDPPFSQMPPALTFWVQRRSVIYPAQTIEPFIPPIPPPTPPTCVVSFGDNLQTATVTFVPSGVTVTVTVPTGPSGAPVALTPATVSQVVTLAASTAGVMPFNPNEGCP